MQYSKVAEQWQRLRKESACLQQQCQVNRQGLDDLRALTEQLSALVVQPIAPLGSQESQPNSGKRSRDADCEASEPHLRKQPSSQRVPRVEDLNGISLEGLQKLLEMERARHAYYLQQLEENACEIDVLQRTYRELSSQLQVSS